MITHLVITEVAVPIYEYECQSCHKVFEYMQRMSEERKTECEECQGALERIISQSAFHLKGGGWYKDLYSSTKKESDSKSAEQSSSDSSSSGNSSESSSSKTGDSSAGSSSDSAAASKSADSSAGPSATKAATSSSAPAKKASGSSE